MNLEVTGNLAEAALWLIVSAVWVAKSIRSKRPLRRVFVFLALAFLVFGISDLIESQTGAWWRPWWLLVLKALCVAGIAGGFGRFYFIARRQRDAPDVTSPPSSSSR